MSLPCNLLVCSFALVIFKLAMLHNAKAPKANNLWGLSEYRIELTIWLNDLHGLIGYT
jgi:hypothetical protein